MQSVDCLAEMFPGLDALDRGLVDQVARISRVVTVAADTVLCRQGAAPDLLHWVLGGRVALSRAGGVGEAAIIDIVEPIRGITPASAVLDEPYPVTAQSLNTTLVMEIEAPPLRALTATRPALATTMMRALSLDVAAAARQIVDLKTRKAAQRLGGFLLSLIDDPRATRYELRLPFRKSLLAGMLGCQPENLSRAFANLREFGVDSHGSRVIIHNVARLREFSAIDDPIRKRPSAADAFARAFDF